MKKRVWRYILAVGVALLHIVIFQIYPAWRFEAVATDWWFKIRGSLPPPEQVVIVGIDEVSHEKLGVSNESTWPRKFHGQLLTQLKKSGVKRVAFDLLFKTAGSSIKDDLRLAEGLKLTPTVIAAGDLQGGIGRNENVGLPFELFVQNAMVAQVVMPVDAGVIRRFKFTREDINPQLPTFAEAATGLADLGGKKPTSRDIINFYGPGGTIKAFPYYRLLDNENPIPIEELRDKVVFVGLYLDVGSPAAPVDQFQTPFYRSRTFGVEIQATAAANIINKDWIRRIDPAYEIVGLTFILLFLALAVVSLKPTWGAVVTFGGALLWGLVSYHFFLAGWFIPGVSAFIMVLPLTFLFSTVYYYAVSAQAEKYIRQAFSLYLMPEMVDEIIRTKRSLELGGEATEVVMMFSDIAEFTPLAEKMNAKDVSDMLNCYFTAASDVVMNERGTVVDYIGDSMFAMWGAPLQVDNGADRAVRAAQFINKAIKELDVAEELPELRTRFGIHFGSVIVGNMGSSKRIKYTALGDAVNLTSRVEQLNKQLGTNVVITKAVKELLTGQYELLPFGHVQVVGKEEAVELWGVFEESLPADLRKKWLSALEGFQSGCWEESEEVFKVLTKEAIVAKAAGLFVEANKEFKTTPPSGQPLLKFKAK